MTQTTHTSPRPTSAADLAHVHDHVRLEFAVAADLAERGDASRSTTAVGDAIAARLA